MRYFDIFCLFKAIELLRQERASEAMNSEAVDNEAVDNEYQYNLPEEQDIDVDDMGYEVDL